MKKIDCRELSYLQIIREIKKYFNTIGEGEAVVYVSNELERSNVIRFSIHQGYQIEENYENEEFLIHLEKRGCLEFEEDEEIFSIIVTTDEFGTGDSNLGKILMKDYFEALNEYDNLPKEIIFLNAGVKLFNKECEVLQEIKMLHKKGVEILINDASINYYKLKQEITFGEITSMYNIVITMKKSKNLIKL